MQEERRLLVIFGLLALSACTGPEKFYDGSTRPDKDTATIVSHRGFSLHVDGQYLVGSASVLPGHHRIVVSSWKKEPYGYVELNAKAGRSYTARTQAVKGGVRSWAVDLETCEVVAGTPPENSGTMGPTELGCVEEKIEIEPEEIAAIILMLPLLFFGAGAVGDIWSPAECAEDCYAGPDAREKPSAKLLVPAWYKQTDESCDTYLSRQRCLLAMEVDGLRVRKNERALLLGRGRHVVVLRVGAKGGFWTPPYTGTDGISLEAKADRVYALCVSPDDGERKLRTWVVDNETGQVIAGRKWGFDVKDVSSYSRFCPLY